MKKIIMGLSLLAIGLNVSAQKITGNWYGSLNVQGSTLHIVFHILKQNGTLTASMDSPDQGAKGLATDTVIFDNQQLIIEAKKFGIKYSGTFIPDSNKVRGTFSQGPMSLPLLLTRDSLTKSAALNTKPLRPQDPLDYPYKREEVVITNKKAGVSLAGTLTLPQGGKASKIVILITGSGPQNRDEEITQFNHRPFLVWSDWLTRQGIAVLRYDDRGIGKSTGTFMNSTTADFADDAEAAVEFIHSRTDLKYLSIGLMGHSEGGMIAPVVASCNPTVSFIILLAGPGVPITQLMIRQSDDQERLNGTPTNIAKLNHDATQRMYNYLAKNKNIPNDQIKPVLDKMIITSLSQYPAGMIGNTPLQELADKQTTTLLNPWFRYFIAFNPADYLTKVSCPVLALNGTLDSQVSFQDNLDAIKADLIKGGNNRYTVVRMSGLNHLFQKATTGAVSEYSQISETVNQEALSTVSGWINNLK